VNVGNCRILTDKERENVMKDMFLKEKNTFNNILFNDLIDIWKYAKKNKIQSGAITNRFGEWGDVSQLLKMTKKHIELYYS
jgi:hypothetical protein